MQYYFDTLPLHPPPEPLESLTSYLTRLAEANTIESFSGLAAICFPRQNPKAFRIQKDYPPPSSFDFMEHVTTCPEDVLRGTTFQYIGDNLGRSTSPKTTYSFYARSVARFLRYCPFCLIEKPYYRLPWRFLILNGCHKHACQFLDVCSHCGCSIPIFSPLLKIGLCPKCKGDLRKCRARTLTEVERQDALNAQRLLEFLLSPQAWQSSHLSRRIALGQKFSASRRENQLTLVEVSQHIGFSVRSLQSIELAESRGDYGASFDVYCTYARYLNISLFDCCREILECVDIEQEKSGRGKKAYDEAQVVELVLEAIERLKSRGKRVTQKNISSAVKINTSLLYGYPKVKVIMQQCVDNVEGEKIRLRQINEDRLYERVVEVINLLEQQGIPISNSSVGKMLGSHMRSFHKYPRIKALLQQKANYYQKQFERTAQREEELLLEAAIVVKKLKESGQRISGKTIREKIGLSQSNLGRYPRVRRFLEEYSPRRMQMEKMYARQKKLLPKVQAAIQSLKQLGQPITRSAIARNVGIHPATLDAYPEVLSIVREAVGKVWKGYEREQLEEDMLAQIEGALQRLKERGSSITKQSISEESGVSLPRLEGYAGVKAVVERAIADYQSIHRRERNEITLLLKAQEALKKFEEMGQPTTREAIAQTIGLSSVNSLSHYPRVLACIRRAYEETTRRAIETRFQLKEDLLVHKALDAIQQLRLHEDPITKKAVSRIVGESVSTINYYPKVKSIIEQAIKSYHV